jgi:hypothetical protein
MLKKQVHMQNRAISCVRKRKIVLGLVASVQATEWSPKYGPWTEPAQKNYNLTSNYVQMLIKRTLSISGACPHATLEIC